MHDLTEQLSTDISKAVNEFRNTVEDAQRLLEGAIAAAHQVFEVASSLRVEEHNKATAAHLVQFLGKPASRPVNMAPAVDDHDDTQDIT